MSLCFLFTNAIFQNFYHKMLVNIVIKIELIVNKIYFLN